MKEHLKDCIEDIAETWYQKWIMPLIYIQDSPSYLPKKTRNKIIIEHIVVKCLEEGWENVSEKSTHSDVRS